MDLLFAHKYTRDIFHMGHNCNSQYLCAMSYTPYPHPPNETHTQSKGSNLQLSNPKRFTLVLLPFQALIWSMPQLTSLFHLRLSVQGAQLFHSLQCVAHFIVSHTHEHTVITHFSDQGDHRTGVKGQMKHFTA